MGKSKTVTLILRKQKSKNFVCEWRPKEHGKPSVENIEKWRNGFNKSLLKGGANEHIGVGGWLQCNLEIFNQKTNEVIVSGHRAPSFEEIP